MELELERINVSYLTGVILGPLQRKDLREDLVEDAWRLGGWVNMRTGTYVRSMSQLEEMISDEVELAVDWWSKSYWGWEHEEVGSPLWLWVCWRLGRRIVQPRDWQVSGELLEDLRGMLKFVGDEKNAQRLEVIFRNYRGGNYPRRGEVRRSSGWYSGEKSPMNECLKQLIMK